MKRLIKIIAIAQLILLYGLIIYPYSSHVALDDSAVQQKNAESQEGHHAFYSVASLFNAIPSENQVNGTNNVPTPTIREHICDYTACPRSAALLFFNLFSDYIVYSQNIHPGFPKTVIAFPFHYFW